MIGRGYAIVIAITLIALVALTVAVRSQGATREPAVVTAIRQEFGSGWLGGCFAAIAWRESRFNAHTSNWTDANGGSHGALQINGVWRRPGESVQAFAARMWDPVQNARLAHQIYRRYGIAPWRSC